MRQLVQGGTTLAYERRIRQVACGNAIAIMPFDPRFQFIIKRITQQDIAPGRNGIELRFIKNDAQPQAGGTASISHALPQIDILHATDRSGGILREALQEYAYSIGPPAFGRRHAAL